ncbi:hypothetical protein [Fibrella forsythiae]|uniref:Uncharacterized protein n=1 Tax=Fibrella forsythiae TaxID=2817061 RepID=A0ABS3JTI2_9BACT|nr:hypothetical protein [Fibrella forsythiae]MBO0953317.1 hypothetical protein [Fibrella forsythiae]
MELTPDRINQLAILFFQRAVLLLVEGEEYAEHQHLLDIIPLHHQIAFLELLGAGTGLRDCFGELDAFLIWQDRTIPLLRQQGILLSTVSQQITMYLLDKQLKVGWPLAALPESASP